MPASRDTLRLTDREGLAHAQGLLEAHLPLEAHGYACTTDDLLKVLLGGAAHTGTVESVCAAWVGSPDPETTRTYFNEQLRVEALPEWEQRLNAAWAAEIPERVTRRAREVAIDLHDRPDYGQATQADGRWVRGQAKHGTTRFYRVATAYVMVKHLRVTLAVRWVLPHDDLVTLLDDLLNRLKTLRIRVTRLAKRLDRGFDGIAGMAYLTRRQPPALIAGTIRGKTGGTRAWCRGRRSYRTRHTFHGAARAAFTADLAVCRVFTTAKRTGRQRRKAGWMIFILIQLDWTPRQARRHLRPAPLRDRVELPLRRPGPRLDHLAEPGLPLRVDWPELRAAQCLGPSTLAPHPSPAARGSLAANQAP